MEEYKPKFWAKQFIGFCSVVVLLVGGATLLCLGIGYIMRLAGYNG